MKMVDITREWTTAPVYPGDPAPQLQPLQNIASGDLFTVNGFSGCLHNGTHMDAPLHAVPEGDDVASVPLSQMIGECTVVEYEGRLLGDVAERLVRRVLGNRILFKGQTVIDRSASYVLADAGMQLIGVESPSVASPEEDAAVHRHFLLNNIVLLENLDLSKVEPGTYFLLAAPMKIAGAEAAPVRAVLLERQIHL